MEIQIILLADRIRAERALKTIILLMVLLVDFEGATRLEVARGAVKNSWLGTVSGSVGVLVSLGNI